MLATRLHARIGAALGGLLRSADSPASFFGVGMANGLLPCGLVYLAAGSAIATGNAWAGAVLMLLFGMGTFPLMIAVMMLGAFILLTLRVQMRRLVPVFVCMTALIMIARGLSMSSGSSQIQSGTAVLQQVQCHP